ncbi:MAG TPA: SRPBCC family protein [Polyangia bacterium]|nr:SRPBCC family protein [Polyangia bacterium]
MSQLRSTQHATFVIERAYLAPPARVFAAWASADAKARWFSGPADKWTLKQRELDFRVGGRELLVGSFTGGAVSAFESRYQDIVPNQRIVYSYDMHIEDRRISVSLATVVFEVSGVGTKLTLTEQGVFLDGLDTPTSREAGTRALLENLDAALLRDTE